MVISWQGLRSEEKVGKRFLFDFSGFGRGPTTYLSDTASLSFSPRPWVVA